MVELAIAIVVVLILCWLAVTLVAALHLAPVIGTILCILIILGALARFLPRARI